MSPAHSRVSVSTSEDRPSHMSLSRESINENVLLNDPSVERCTGDPSSFSTPDQITVVHMDINWNINFRKTRFEGDVILHLVRRLPKVQILCLDTWNLDIKTVSGGKGKDAKPLQYRLHPHMGFLGSKLEILLPERRNDPDVVSIEYNTSSHAKALEWVLAEHTEGKRYPFMFSQCECIRCRSIIPCQDTPYVKTTYSAKISAPMDLTVLMSGTKKGKVFLQPKGRKLHKFVQNIPIPSYLIAIAVGEFEFSKLGPRTRVWCEPPLLERAAMEFQATETMLEAAEAICGPYEWEKYHILVMPHAFTFLAMENPGITFISQNVLVGDQSLIHVLAHEIAHSWMGNLVTNKNFEHFWLNEGLCTFVERKIIGMVLGWEFRLFFASRGMKRLREVIKAKGFTHPHTKLVVDLKFTSPDTLISAVPYEKGHTFMYYLESLIGNHMEFDNFLKTYVETFKIQSIDSDMFKNFFCEYFSAVDAVKFIDWDAWLNTPGLPPAIPNYRTRLEEECLVLRNKWMFWDEDVPHTFSKADVANLCPFQVQEFLDLMLVVNLPLEKLVLMEKIYNFMDSGNMDTRYKWLLLCIRRRYRDIIPYALGFVQQVGRLSYVISIYRALYEWNESREWAIRVFANTYKTMGRRSARLIAKDLNVELNF
ncbi:hypothetical protein R5R35_002186 [Gryllus longicercus]